MTNLRVTVPFTNLRETPDDNALRGKLESQLVYGEGFSVDTEKDGWVQGTCTHDGYKGWVRKDHLAPLPATTHIVTAQRSDLYRDATMKSPIVNTYSFGSRVTVAEAGEKFAKLNTGEWIYAAHLSGIDSKDEDHVATAKKFLDVPYHWGGRSGFGIDCSGLVQIALTRANIKTPRDTEQQIDAIGHPHDRSRTGDIVFFPGHIGIMVDDENIIHANAHHMKVTIEPLWMVEERSKNITGIRRL